MASWNFVIIGLGNGLSLVCHETIAWTNDDLLQIGLLGTKLQWNLNQNIKFYINENFFCETAKNWLFCWGLTVIFWCSDYMFENGRQDPIKSLTICSVIWNSAEWSFQFDAAWWHLPGLVQFNGTPPVILQYWQGDFDEEGGLTKILPLWCHAFVTIVASVPMPLSQMSAMILICFYFYWSDNMNRKP